ncbi:MAG: sigma-70 family RNA polymerase sigma factor [Pseudomonadota bacterium]
MFGGRGKQTGLRQPNNTALERLYRRYFLKLKTGLARTYGAGPPDPEDVAQAAFSRLGDRPDLSKIQDPESYLWIAARNIIMTEKRRDAVKRGNAGEIERRFFGETCDVIDPERVFMAKDLLNIVMEVLAGMPERRRRIFMLHRVHGLTLDEAGKRCGVTRTAAIRHVGIATRLITEAVIKAEALPDVRAAE